MFVFDSTIGIRFRVAGSAALTMGSASVRATCFFAGFDFNDDGRNSGGSQ
jgi:hypothetical protein